ncbi:MAG: hypothetical protein KDA25_06420, partial [Phycisphaerales bacterium]|nr:hypothetical protein [Phycisphaerales bacterium]
FATDWFGQAHWSDAQVAAWRAGHAAEASPVERLGALWNQWLRFGIGPDPSAPEPWRPQWGALPWLGLAGLVVAWLRTGRRRVVTGLCALLVVQIVFWMLFTHLKSRFLLPTVVPLSLLGALAWSGRRGTIAPAARIAAGSTILLLSTGPVVLFLSERDGAPADEIGAAEVMSGRALSASEREMAGMALSPIIATNYVLDASARVLLVGEAVPLYYRLDRITYATTWDRGPMSEVVAAAPDDPAAWVAALRARGFTHVLVNPIMLDLWTEAGWNDPNLTPVRILDGLRTHARVRFEYADGRTLFELR